MRVIRLVLGMTVMATALGCRQDNELPPRFVGSEFGEGVPVPVTIAATDEDTYIRSEPPIEKLLIPDRQTAEMAPSPVEPEPQPEPADQPEANATETPATEEPAQPN